MCKILGDTLIALTKMLMSFHIPSWWSVVWAMHFVLTYRNCSRAQESSKIIYMIVFLWFLKILGWEIPIRTSPEEFLILGVSVILCTQLNSHERGSNGERASWPINFSSFEERFKFDGPRRKAYKDSGHKKLLCYIGLFFLSKHLVRHICIAD